MRATRIGPFMMAGIAAGLALPVCAWAGSGIRISSPSMTEGNSGTTTLPFAITRSGDTGSQIILEYFTENGSATEPADYVSLSRSELHIPLSATAATINVSVNGDAAPEENESLLLLLSAAAAIGPDPTLGAPARFSVGNELLDLKPQSIALGDVNGDGRLDVAVGNSGSYDVGVLLNTTPPGATSPSFASPVSFIAPAPIAVALGDINGDGRPDLVVSNASSLTGDISVRINTTTSGAATPTFADPVDVLPRSSCGATKVGFGDLNNDGRLDIVAACSTSGRLVVLLNNTAPGASTPNFSNAGSVVFEYSFSGLALSDFNYDGRVDVALTNVGGLVFVLLNTTLPGASTVSFAPTTTLPVKDGTQTVAAGDINGDGRPDLVVAVNQQQGDPDPPHVSVLLNSTPPGAASPAFAAPVDFLTVNNFVKAELGDINGDGRLDILVGMLKGVGSPVSFQTFLNTTPAGAATPRFHSAGSVPLGGWMFALTPGDLNNDGSLDLALIDYATNYQNLVVALNTTQQATYAPEFSAPAGVGAGAASAVAADFNGDGRPDLAAADSTGDAVSVLLSATSAGAAAVSFSAPASFAAGDGPSAMIATDLNGDGRPDLATANAGGNNVSVLINTAAPGAATPAFAGAGRFGAGAEPRDLAAGDFNGDGKPDLATANAGSNDVTVLFNTTAPGSTSAGFASAGTFAAGTGPSSVALGDLNHDGRTDMATANADSNNVSVLLSATAPGAAAASFAAASHFDVGTSPGSVALGDINGDGRPDLATANAGSNTLSVLLNTTAPGATTASFAAASHLAVGSGPAVVALRDVNGDGKPDLVVANSGGNDLSVLINATAPGAASASFTPLGSLGAGSGPVSVFVDDLNGDGQNDLLAANGPAGTVSVLLNRMFTVNLIASTGTGTILDDDTDAVPDAYSFTPQSGVATSTVVASNSITVAGINVPAGISVAGGEYSVNGGGFTAVAGTVGNGQSVRVRHTSAATPNSATNTTLTIGGISDIFTSTTAVSGGGPDTTPESFAFATQENVALSTAVVSNAITVSGIDAPAAISVADGEYSVNGGGFTAVAGTVGNGQSVRVRHTSAATANTATNTTLTIGGVTGSFTSTTAAAPQPPPSSGSGGALSLLEGLAGLILWLFAGHRQRAKSSLLGPRLC